MLTVLALCEGPHIKPHPLRCSVSTQTTEIYPSLSHVTGELKHVPENEYKIDMTQTQKL